MPFSAIDASVTPQSMQSRFSKPVLLSLHQDRTEPVNLQKKGITMTAIRERHRLLFGRLHTSLTACLVVLVGIGQPVILHAGACEDCEKTKINQLRACNTTLDTDVEKCAVDADTAQTICISIEQGKIAQAEVDRKSALKNALGAYCITVGFCALLPPPANAACLMEQAASTPTRSANPRATITPASPRLELNERPAIRTAKLLGRDA